ncbi:MAG: ATP-binding protein [Nitrososphaeria archaeon]
MLFSPEPKSSRKDFFDKEEELERLKKLPSPINLVVGLRRTGKSSLIRICLNELNLPSIYIDLRKFEDKGYITYKDFILDFEEKVNKLVKSFPELINLMKRVRGVKVLGNEISFFWSGKNVLKFSDLLEVLDSWADDRVVIVLDEVQELIKLRGYDLLPSLAYAFDNLKKVRIVLSGSKMGLLYRFLKVYDVKTPLYGRAFSKIELKPLTRDEAISFLKAGFEELKIPFDRFEEVYEKLGGIPGWLTYFGFRYSEYRDFDRSLAETLNVARKLILEEFENFLKDKEIARKRYYTVMKTLSKGGRWNDVKHALESVEGVRVSDSIISNYLNKLCEISFIEKNNSEYKPTDPLIGWSFSL